MEQFLQWINMGGYSLYVWTSYSLVIAVMVIELVRIKIHKTRTRTKLVQWFKKKQQDYDSRS